MLGTAGQRIYIYTYIIYLYNNISYLYLHICQIRRSIAQEILPSMFSRISSQATMLLMALRKWAHHISTSIICQGIVKRFKKYCSNNLVLPEVSGTLKTSNYMSICQTRAADISESCESWKSSESWTSEAAFEKHPSLQQCRPGKVELFDFVFHSLSIGWSSMILMQTQRKVAESYSISSQPALQKREQELPHLFLDPPPSPIRSDSSQVNKNRSFFKHL